MVVVLLAAVGVQAAGNPVAPLPGPAEPPTEIIVTGERASKSLRETPSSVTVATRSMIEGSSVDRIDQLLASIPNVQLGSGGDAPAIRGQDSTGPLRDLPAFLGGNRPRVTLQLDGRAISYNELAFGVTPLWDVEQVEVYRSPQTGTQGRNAIAGAIFVTTALPSEQFTGRARMIVDDHHLRQWSAMVSGPLAGPTVRFRLTADVRDARATTKIDSAADADPNRDDNLSLRGKLLLEPKAFPQTRLQLVAAHITSAAPQINGAAVPYQRRRDPYATYGIFRTRVDSLTLLADSELTSSLAVRGSLTFGDANVRRYAPPGFGVTRNRINDQSAEASFDWRAAKHLRVRAGARLDRSALDQQIDLSATAVGIGDFLDEQTSVGLFGEAQWSIDPITLTVGGRFQHDRQDRRGALMTRLGPVSLDYRGSFDAFLPKATFSYQLTPELQLGVMVLKAYNPGGTTIDLARGQAQQFGQEHLWDFEAFARLFDRSRRLRWSANLFHQSMFETQRAIARRIVTPVGTINFAEIVNQPRAFSRGLETDVAWQVDDHLSLSVGLGLLRTKITKTVSASDPALGRVFARSPRWTGSASLTWTPTPQVRATAQLRHNDRYFSDDFETASLEVEPTTVADARIEWTLGKTTVFAYARNLFDRFYLTYKFARVPTRPDLATPGDGRRLGIGLDLRF